MIQICLRSSDLTYSNRPGDGTDKGRRVLVCVDCAEIICFLRFYEVWRNVHFDGCGCD